MAASLPSQETYLNVQPYVHKGKRHDLTPPVDSSHTAQTGLLPDTCTMCGHHLEQERNTPGLALSFVQRSKFLMSTYTALRDCRRYTLMMLFCFTVLTFSSILKYFETPSSLNSTCIKALDYRACDVLTLWCFTGIGSYGTVKYWQSLSRKRSGRYTEALDAARAARDAALLALGTGISLGIIAAATVRSS